MIEEKKRNNHDLFLDQEVRLNNRKISYVFLEQDNEEDDTLERKKMKEQLNNSLNKLELLIDKGEVDLGVSSEDTDDEAINEAIKDLLNQEMEQNGELEEEEEEEELEETYDGTEDNTVNLTEESKHKNYEKYKFQWLK